MTNRTGEDIAPAGWRDGTAKRAVQEFVRRAVAEVPPEERVAVFDNDGTLWCEKPMPIQLDFILRRLAEMAEADPALRKRQPWRAAYRREYGWLAAVLDEHYAGDDRNVRILAAGILAAYDGMTVEDFEAQSERFLREVRHPTLGREYWTTVRRSPSGSGAAPAAAPCSPRATPTATSPCSTSPSGPASRSCDCLSSTMTPIGSSTMSRAPSRR